MPPRRRPSNPNRRSRFTVDSPDMKRFTRDLSVLLGVGLPEAERLFKTAASGQIVLRAVAAAESQGGVAAKSATDIHTAGPGVVVYGGNGYNMGAEFGAYRYKQFKQWRGNKDDAGYFFWPAIREFRDRRMVELWYKELFRPLRRTFPS